AIEIRTGCEIQAGVVFNGRHEWERLGEAESATGRAKAASQTLRQIKSPEVMLNSFVSASSSLYTLADLTSPLSLAGATSDLCLGSGLTANRINQFNASGLYPAFDIVFLFASTSAWL